MEDLEEAKARAQADLNDVNNRLGRTKAEMAETNAGLTQVQREAQKRFEQDMHAKQGELRNLTERVNSLKKQAEELTEEVRSKGAQLQSIENGFNEARRRLAG